MEFRQLNYFIKAAEMLHFTAAAEASFVTQSTLSQQVKQLEDELGMLLFDRVGKQVRLTEAGNVFLVHARQIILDIKKAKQAIFELNNLVNGELKIGVTYAFSSLLESKLRVADLDFMVAFHEEEDNAGLEMQQLFSSRITMVVSKKNPLASLSKISLKDLGKLELILPSNGFSSRDLLNEMFRKNNISPRIKIEMNDVHSLLSMVETGHWATIINEKAISSWENLVAIPISGKELYKQAFILSLKGAYQKKSASLFIDELMKIV